MSAKGVSRRSAAMPFRVNVNRERFAGWKKKSAAVGTLKFLLTGPTLNRALSLAMRVASSLVAEVKIGSRVPYSHFIAAHASSNQSYPAHVTSYSAPHLAPSASSYQPQETPGPSSCKNVEQPP